MQKSDTNSSQWSEEEKDVYAVTVRIDRKFLGNFPLEYRRLMLRSVFDGAIDEILKGMK